MSRGPRDNHPIEQWASQIDWKNTNWQGGAASILVFIVFLAVVWGGMTSYYTVQPEGQAVVKRFGRVVAVKPPGLHFKLPFGIDQQTFVPTARVLKQEFGFRTVDTSLDSVTEYDKGSTHQDESLMLTGDLKVVDVEWVVQFRVDDPNKYLHRVRDIEQTIRDSSEAVMRRIVGNSLGSDVLTIKRVQIATTAKEELQEILTAFDMGITIGTVELQDVTPPDPVKPAFNEVNQAEQEKERMINEAEKRRNQMVPRASGEAKQLIEAAEGYRAQRVNRATGEVARFKAITDEYRNSPEVTRRRMHLEMIDSVMPNLGRVIVVEPGQTSPIPLMNLDSNIPSPALLAPQTAPQSSVRGPSSSGQMPSPRTGGQR
ncbi:MAG TPA: FtsH protease activity modulator HflK [Planctomycetaceae bacterium]|nr:FtsH protease activity modulator HflK [Planctomycetaceae bacterium]